MVVVTESPVLLSTVFFSIVKSNVLVSIKESTADIGILLFAKLLITFPQKF